MDTKRPVNAVNDNNPYLVSAESVAARRPPAEGQSRLSRWAMWFAFSSWGLVVLKVIFFGVGLLLALAVSRDYGRRVVDCIPLLGLASVLTTLLAIGCFAKAWIAGVRGREMIIAGLLGVAHLGLLCLAAVVLVAGAFAQ